MAIGDVYRLSCRSQRSASGDDAVNVFHFRQETLLILDTPAEDLVGAFIVECELAYRNCFNPAYVLDLYTVRQVTGGTEAFEQSASAAGNVGSAANQLAAQVSGIISWKTGQAGRSKRGRTYLPPSDEAEISSGEWISDYFTRADSFITSMIDGMSFADLTHAGWTLGVWSEVLTEFTPITTGQLRSVPGTQRKRRLGVGS